MHQRNPHQVHSIIDREEPTTAQAQKVLHDYKEIAISESRLSVRARDGFLYTGKIHGADIFERVRELESMSDEDSGDYDGPHSDSDSDDNRPRQSKSPQVILQKLPGQEDDESSSSSSMTIIKVALFGLGQHAFLTHDGRFGIIGEDRGVPLFPEHLKTFKIKNFFSCDGSNLMLVQTLDSARRVYTTCVDPRECMDLDSSKLTPIDVLHGKEIVNASIRSDLLGWNQALTQDGTTYVWGSMAYQYFCSNLPKAPWTDIHSSSMAMTTAMTMMMMEEENRPNAHDGTKELWEMYEKEQMLKDFFKYPFVLPISKSTFCATSQSQGVSQCLDPFQWWFYGSKSVEDPLDRLLSCVDEAFKRPVCVRSHVKFNHMCIFKQGNVGMDHKGQLWIWTPFRENVSADHYTCVPTLVRGVDEMWQSDSSNLWIYQSPGIISLVVPYMFFGGFDSSLISLDILAF